MSEDKTPYTTTPHVRHTTFGQLPIGAKFIWQHRDGNSPDPWTKTDVNFYDNLHDPCPSPDAPVTWLTDAEVEAERQARDMPSEIARTPSTDPAATNPPTGASKLARLVGLEKRVRGIVKKLSDHADKWEWQGKRATDAGADQAQAFGIAGGMRTAVDLLSRALAGEGGAGDDEEGAR